MTEEFSLHPLFSPEQIRRNEGAAAEREGLTMWQLMERAGQAVFRCLRQHYSVPTTVAVLCGPGNNGGDGLVLATIAQQAGYQVRVFAEADAFDKQSLEAALALNLWLESGGEVEPLTAWPDAEADVVIDALLGTGLNSRVRGIYGATIENVNTRKLPVLAVDIPSGLNGETGQVMGSAVEATHTISFIGMKRGLYTADARDYCGQLWYADLGLATAIEEETVPAAWRLESKQLRSWLPKRKEQSHKGLYGHVLIVGGQRGMAGAVRLAGEAALRSGAGKVTIVCEPGQEELVVGVPELMVLGLDAREEEHAAEFERLLMAVDVVAVGPGLGQSDWGQSLWVSVLASSKPMVVDADALNFLAQAQLKRENWILTPHPGEAATLLGTDNKSIQANRWESAKALQEKYGGTVVLKGSGTLVQGKEYVAVCTAGSAALASAGTGDVLTGITAGIWAQAEALGLSQWQVACTGVLVHGLAGECVASSFQTDEKVTRGLCASDLMTHIVRWVNPNEGNTLS